MSNNKKEVILKSLCYIVFTVYVLFLMKIILFKYTGIFDLFEKIAGGNLDGFRSFNLIPFQSFLEFGTMLINGDFARGFINLAGNMLIFAPFGYFLPLLFKSCQKLWKIILVGFIISCSFELCQYFLYLGSADIDDVILNVMGTILGLLCYKFLTKLTKNNAGVSYMITLILSVVGFVVALLIAIDYFGLMFGIRDEAKPNKKQEEMYQEDVLEEFDDVKIETNAENEFDILGNIVSVEGDILTINQVIEVDENSALSSTDNRNLKTIHLLPSTQYSQLDIYDAQGKKVETKTAKKEDLQVEQLIDMKGYVDGEEFFATEIVINNYLFSK